AVSPRITLPGLVPLAGHGRLFAAEGAHVALDRRPHPDRLAGLGVTRLNLADDTELAAGEAGDDHVVHDEGRRAEGVGVLIVGYLLPPAPLTGLLIERQELRVEGTEDDQVVVDGGAAVDDVAAGENVPRQAVVVFPQLLAGPCID